MSQNWHTAYQNNRQYIREQLETAAQQQMVHNAQASGITTALLQHVRNWLSLWLAQAAYPARPRPINRRVLS